MNEKLISYIENSFLSNLLTDSEITDVCYNGVNFFYMHNQKGRIKADIKASNEEVLDFIRQIANYSEKIIDNEEKKSVKTLSNILQSHWVGKGY